MRGHRTLLRLHCAGVILLVGTAGCGGGAAIGAAGPPITPSTAAPTPVGTANPAGTFVQVSITFPARPAGTANRRRPAYISPSIQSVSIAIDAGTPTYVNAPTPTGSPQTIVTTIAVAAGIHQFLISEYDQANGTGHLLGDVAQSSTIVANTTNVLVYTLNGNLAKILIQTPASSFVEGTLAAGLTLVGCQPQPFNAVPQDADGNTIVVPGLIPQVSESSASGAIALTQPGNNQFTLQGAAPSAPIAITASGTDLNGNTVATRFNVGSTAAFYVADYTAQKIRVFDESGTPLALPAGFPAISNPMGVTATPCTAGAGGNIYVTQTANPTYPYVAAFDMNGNPLTLFGGAFTFMPGLYQQPQPALLAYGAGTLFVPDEYSDMLSEFDPAGNTVPIASGTFPHLSQPIGAAFDSHNQRLYVANEGTAALTVYGADGTYIGTVATNNHPFDVAFDSNNNAIYVASGGTSGAALGGATPSPANVAEFSEVPAAVSNAGGFSATSTTAFYTGIAFDPFTKQLYVSDAGDSKIVAYTETGASVTLPSGAFSTINATSSPKGDPMGIVFVP